MTRSARLPGVRVRLSIPTFSSQPTAEPAALRLICSASATSAAVWAGG
jgi:hypothetical protein